MSSLNNKLSLKTFELVYPYEYDFKSHYNTIDPGQIKQFFPRLLIKVQILSFLYKNNIYLFINEQMVTI